MVTNLDLLLDKRWFMENMLAIANKNAETQRLMLNPAQLKAHELLTGANRAVILKARQMGISTYVLGSFFHDVITTPNLTVAIISHEDFATQRLFDKVKIFLDHLPKAIRPQVSHNSTHELVFTKLHSTMYVGTGGARSFGRGDTIHRCLVSELAFYGPNAEKLMNGLQEAVPNSGTLWVESTPQGEGNYFHKLWRQAAAKESNFKPVFLPWHLLPEYQLPVDSEFANPLDKGHLTFTDEERQLVDKYGITEDQVRWRRMKMAQKRQLFFQEYPEDDMSCFLSSGMSVFDLNKLGKLTLRCREPNEVEDNGALRIWQLPREGEHYIIGADVAEGMTKGWSAAVVVNAASLEHVATLRGRWETNIYGQKLADLGTKYNGALVAVERNSVGNSVLNTLVNQVNYPNVYMEVDARGLRTGKYGWVTSVATKPLMVANARSYIESYSLTTWDEKLMADLRRLRYLPGYKIGTGDDTEYDGEEEEGSHSDIAMAMFIALIVRQQAPTQATGIQRKKSESY